MITFKHWFRFEDIKLAEVAELSLGSIDHHPDIAAVVEAFYRFMLSVGYTSEAVTDYLRYIADMYSPEDDIEIDFDDDEEADT